ncbi:MAG: ABC transporter substrate-binding protein [Candidatus Bipolaricaulia bacterium]
MLKRSLSFAVIAAFAVAAMFSLTGSNAAQAQDGPITFATSFQSNELEAFKAVISKFEDQTGIQVQVQQIGRDMAGVLGSRVAGGNPPDLANVPNPGLFAQFEEDLASLEWFRETDVADNTLDSFLEAGTYNGTLFGVVPGASYKSLVWYNKPVFEEEGYSIPQSLGELLQLQSQMVADGYMPWCIGVESGGASGWPGTDWMEDLALRVNGADFYDAWVNHDVSWNDPRVGQLFHLFGNFANDQMAFGGTQNIINTGFGAPAVGNMFTDPPRCLMYKMASFANGIIQSNFDVTLGEDYDAFTFPSVGGGSAPALVAGDFIIAFNDNDRIRQLIQFWASAEAQAMFARQNPGRIAVNTNVSMDVYPNSVIRNAAQAIQEAPVARFDASDSMPSAVGSDQYWTAVLDYLRGTPVPEIQSALEDAADEAYNRGDATD